eukprot:TRINITY_DN4039_c0_g1_i2.p1 TRINITY_DN4039_c0_g1~~TRINITY_DN4039_c0_g1_i2.p1  ORF type:complete len:114 (+),score=18.88 TRINITY_DN4039_c0_g1_i2:623-964(+)
MDSLEKTRALCPTIDRIFPGHGPDLFDGNRVISNYINHRLERERQILNVLAKASGSMTGMDIVRIIYASYDPDLWPAAERSVRHHLEKLYSERKLEKFVGNHSQDVTWKLGKE